MDEELKSLLNELEEAEAERAEHGDDDAEDRFFTAASHVAYYWRKVQTPNPLRDLSPQQKGIAFSFDLDTERVTLRPVDG